jgi:SAM-dependent methyltransferase
LTRTSMGRLAPEAEPYLEDTLMETHEGCDLRSPGTAEVDYDALWSDKWGDLQRHGPASRHQRRIMAAMLDPLRFESVLDVGCGEGSLLAFLGGRYACRRMAGLDIAGPAIERARRTFPSADYFAGAIASLPPGSRFELVTCIDVLEHVDEDVELLRGIASVCSGFALCVTVQGRMWPGEREIGHVRNYCRGELTEKMRQAGLTPIRTVEWGFPFYSPLFRSIVATSRSEPLSYGTYGLGRRLLCHALYSLFLMNSWKRGDKIFVLAEPTRSGPR